LNRCAKLIETGKLETVVSHEFALEDAAKAHALIEQGHVLGKVILAT
jgi:NADPH2:quinone reductase